MTDPIADLLTRIRNGQMARKEVVNIPYSRLKKEMLEVLVAKGFLQAVKEQKDASTKSLNVELDSSKNLTFTRISKPGQRIYAKKGTTGRVLNGYGIALLSTSQGILSGEDAMKSGVGGEVLCEIY